MKKSFIIIFIIMLSCFPFVYSEVISEKELRNDFTNDNWFQSSDGVKRNTTLNGYQLNYTLEKEYQNFSIYTETDTSGLLTLVNDTCVSWSGEMRNTANHWFYRDYTTRATSDFEYDFDVYIDSVEISSRTVTCGLLYLQNQTEDYIYARDNNQEGLYVLMYSNNIVNRWYLGFNRLENGVSTINISISQNNLDIDRWYYLRLKRISSKYYLELYDDSDRTTMLQDLRLDLSLGNIYTYNKIFTPANLGYGTTKVSAGSIKNLTLNKVLVGVSKGFLYFKNLLENTTYTGIWYLTNQTYGSDIQVSFSEDNSTWLMNTTLTDGNEVLYIEPLGLNPLYVKYRFDNGLALLENASVIHGALEEGTYNYGYNNSFPSSFDEVTGATEIGVDINNFKYPENVVYVVSETVGTPAFIIELNFTNVENDYLNINLDTYYRYTGNLAHNITLEVYNWSSNRFKKMDNYVDNVPSYDWLNISMSYWSKEDLINNGKIYTRIVHNSAGNINHDFEIDYYSLTYYEAVKGVGGTGVSNWWIPLSFFIVVPVLLILVNIKRR